MAEQMNQQLNTKPSVTIETPMTHEDTVTPTAPRASYTLSMIRHMLEEHSSLSLEENASRLKKNQASECNAVDELRKDVISVRETLESAADTERVIENANYTELKAYLEQIQSTLNDAVAELTLETEAMINK